MNQMFAFSGAYGELFRDAGLRGDPTKIDAQFAKAKILVFWQGKLAVAREGPACRPLWLSSTDRLVQGAGLRVYLGRQGDVPLFAVDLHDCEGASPLAATSPFDASLVPHHNLPLGSGFADLRSLLADLSPLDGECAATAKALLTWHAKHGFCANCGAASTPVQAGWQRDCATCSTAHFPRTDPVVIMLVQRNGKVLLGRCKDWPEGMYSLLAGFVEPGEGVEAAVRREVFEETGVEIGHVRYLANQPWPFPANLMLGCIAEAQSDEITLDPNELEDAVWLTKSEVLQVQLGHNPKVKPSRKGAIAQYLIEEWLAGRID